MKVKKFNILALAALIVLSSCASEQESKQLTFVIEEQPQVFIVEHDGHLAWVEDTKDERDELNRIRAIREDEDEQEEFEIKSRLSNVRRIIDNELIVGFDEELDNPEFKTVENT